LVEAQESVEVGLILAGVGISTSISLEELEFGELFIIEE